MRIHAQHPVPLHPDAAKPGPYRPPWSLDKKPLGVCRWWTECQCPAVGFFRYLNYDTAVCEEHSGSAPDRLILFPVASSMNNLTEIPT